MTIIRVKEIRGMSSYDSQKRLRELQTELVRLKTMIKAGGAIENPSRVSELRKAIARIHTIRNEPALQPKEEKKPEKKQAPKKKERNKKE